MYKLRLVITSFLAFGITFGLFLFMHSLVSHAEPKLDESKSERLIDFIRVKEQADLNFKERELPQKKNEKPPPKTPKLQDLASQQNAPTMKSINVATPKFEKSLDLVGGPVLGSAPGDSDVVPFVRVEPLYPQQAAERGVEGWVVVKFSISTTGTVKNPKVLSSHPPGVFEKAAIRAIRRWKYKPKIVDGNPVERSGIAVKLKFELDSLK